MKYENYRFEGKWEFEFKFSIFGNLIVSFSDDLDDTIEPSLEQIRTLNFIIEKQSELLSQLEREVWKNWKKISRIYSFEDYEETAGIRRIEQIKTFFKIHSINISTSHKNGFCYFLMNGYCKWDEEHGVGFSLKKSKVIRLGDAGESLDLRKEKVDNEKQKLSKIPKLYDPHPVFKTFKPSHEYANSRYAHELIKKNLNERFFEFLRKQGNDVNFIHSGLRQSDTYLSSACLANNEEIFEFLISKNANIGGVLKCAIIIGNKKFVEVVLNKGASFFENSDNYRNDNVFVEAVWSYLEQFSWNLSNPRNDRLDERKAFLLWLKTKGAKLEFEDIEGLLKNHVTGNFFHKIHKEAMSLIKN